MDDQLSDYDSAQMEEDESADGDDKNDEETNVDFDSGSLAMEAEDLAAMQKDNEGAIPANQSQDQSYSRVANSAPSTTYRTIAEKVCSLRQVDMKGMPVRILVRFF